MRYFFHATISQLYLQYNKVGHTHNQVDARFGNFVEDLAANDVVTWTGSTILYYACAELADLLCRHPGMTWGGLTDWYDFVAFHDKHAKRKFHNLSNQGLFYFVKMGKSLQLILTMTIGGKVIMRSAQSSYDTKFTSMSSLSGNQPSETQAFEFEVRCFF